MNGMNHQLTKELFKRVEELERKLYEGKKSDKSSLAADEQLLRAQRRIPPAETQKRKVVVDHS